MEVKKKEKGGRKDEGRNEGRKEGMKEERKNPRKEERKNPRKDELNVPEWVVCLPGMHQTQGLILTRHSGAHLQSQHSGGKGRRIKSPRSSLPAYLVNL